MIRSTLAVFLAAAAVQGCGKPTAPNEERTIAVAANDDTYEVAAFGMTAAKPAGWFAMNDVEASAIMDTGKKLAAGDDRALRALVEAGSARTRTLFGFFEHEIGAPVPVNANVMAIAENVGTTPGVKTGKDYFFHAKRLMQATSVHYTFKDGAPSRRIGGVEFDRMDAAAEIAGNAFSQSYYAARRGDYMLVFVETYGSPEDQRRTSAVLDSVSFKR